jgi:POT family proton-dependent oligopeptide transporter
MTTERIKHPPGLPVLFFAELWERFGFYCVQALLVLYLTQKLMWGDKQAYDMFSAFSALIYATPVIGGYLADRLLGYRRAILVGTGLYILGYFGLGSLHPAIFNLALACLIAGNGFFKPNVSSLLGQLYNDPDPRRESGFTLFYMGINIGSFLAPLVCTYIAVNYGWHYGFASAGVGMLICLAICVGGFHRLGDIGKAPIALKAQHKLLFYPLLFIGLIAISQLLHHDTMVNNILIGFGVVTYAILIGIAFFEQAEQRSRLIALIILMVFSVIFWALYVQTFSSLTLFTERNIDRNLLGTIVPTGMFSSINPFFIIILSPLLAVLWLRLNHRRSSWNPSVPMKFALALILMGAGFLALVVGIKFAGPTGLVCMCWLILNYFLQTIGELVLSPIGLSAVTTLSPPRIVGMMMGVWFLSSSAAYAIGGKIADLTALPSAIANNPLLSAPVYETNFYRFGIASVVIGIAMIFLVPKLRRMVDA